MFHLKFTRPCAVLSLLFLVISAPAQFTIDGVANRSTYNNSVAYRVQNAAGFTFSAWLNGQPVAVGVSNTITRPDFYELYVSRMDNTTSEVSNRMTRFIVVAGDRGNAEWGIPRHTPFPVIQSADEEFSGGALRVMTPQDFPTGYEIPVVTWVVDEQLHALRANGLLSAPGQNTIRLLRGTGSGFLASNQPPGALTYAPSAGGLSTNKTINLQSGTVWTSVTGTLGDTTWPDNSRIRVTGHLSVPDGVTLNIGAGTIVLLSAGVNITNNGAVLINGSIEQPVVFMPNSRAQPWGGFFMRTSTGLLVANGTIFTGCGADPNGGAGHRDEQCLFLVDSTPTVTLTDCAAIYMKGQFGHAYSGGTFNLTRLLVQRCTTGGEYTRATFRVNDSAFIECLVNPDTGTFADYVDGDNDGLYLIGGVHGFTNTLFGWVKDDGVDSGGTDSSGNYAQIRYQSCWFESAYHEGNSLSGYKDVRVWDTVYLDCGQGIEDGYDAPTGRVDRCLFLHNKSGVRHGDNYSTFSFYRGLMTATNCILLNNHRDIFGYNWDNEGGWTNNWGQCIASGNFITAADTNFPDNTVWNPTGDAWRLGAFGARGRVGAGIGVYPGQSGLANFPDGIPVGLSSFCTNTVTVEYAVDSSDGGSTGGSLVFVPGEMRKFIPLPGSFSGVLRVSLTGAVNADITTTPALLFQNVSASGTPTVLSPLGASWRYLDNGTEQGTAWRAPDFNDSLWSNGVARLGFGSDPAPLVTTIRRYVTGTSGPQITNFYFRRAIVVTNPADFASVQFRYQRDDGCIVYLNGAQLFTNNMPLPPITANTFAASTISGAAATLTFWTNTLPASVLQPGTNVIAVEVHQVTSTSSDIVWDLEIQGLSAPRVNISRLGGDVILFWGDPAFALEQSPEAHQGTWSPAGSASPVPVDPVDAMRVYRLKR